MDIFDGRDAWTTNMPCSWKKDTAQGSSNSPALIASVHLTAQRPPSPLNERKKETESVNVSLEGGRFHQGQQTFSPPSGTAHNHFVSSLAKPAAATRIIQGARVTAAAGER